MKTIVINIVFPILILFICSINSIYSQTNEAGNYRFDKFSFSPAYAGYNQNIECFLNFGQKWVGIAGAPRVQGINFNAPFGHNAGYGMTISNTQTGNFRHSEISPAFSYKIQATDSLFVSFGINVLFYHNQLELSKVRSQGFDPQLQNTNSLKTFLFDLGSGVVFNYRKLSAGINVPFLLSQNKVFQNSELEYLRYRTWTGLISYPVVVHKVYFFDPAFYFQTVSPDISGNFSWTSSVLIRYKRKIWSGISISSGNRVGITMGGAISDKVIINYSYEYGFSGIESASSGSHNITLGFLIKRAVKRKEPTIFPLSEEVTILENNTVEIEKLQADMDLLRKQSNKILNDHKKEIVKLRFTIDSLNALNGPGNKNLFKTEEKWENAYPLGNIKFGGNSDKLFSSSFSELNKIVAFLMKNPKLKIKITGYTDNQGSQSYNQYLSEKRAIAVGDYIKRRGIDPARISSFGKGIENPIGDNKTEEGRAKNNRIEVQYNIPE